MASVLRGRMDLSRIGMSGHSFGAITTQAVSGQCYASGGQRFTDPRIDAAILFSPSRPRRGTPEEAFAKVPLPGESGGRNPNHHLAILAISTAFRDATLKGDAQARVAGRPGGP
jgi:hypothetical protein